METYREGSVAAELARERAVRVALMERLGALGCAAMIVGPDRRVEIGGEQARDLAEDGLGLSARRLTACRPSEQGALDDLIRSALPPLSRPAGPLAISRRSGGKPFLVSALPIASSEDAAGEEGSAMILVTDPESAPGTASARLLELLGLTPAESRIAALVGSGIAPRDAARRAGVTEQTARFTLKRVYSKLDIGRQAQLVQLMGRLVAVGGQP